MPAIPAEWAQPVRSISAAKVALIRSEWSKLVWQARKIVSSHPSPEVKAAYAAFRASKPPIVARAFAEFNRRRKLDPKTVQRSVDAMAKARSKGLPNRSPLARLEGFACPPEAKVVVSYLSADPKPGSSTPRKWPVIFLQLPHPEHIGLLLRFKASAKGGAFVASTSPSRGRIIPNLRPFAHQWKPIKPADLHSLPPFVQDFLHRVSFDRIPAPAPSTPPAPAASSHPKH